MTGTRAFGPRAGLLAAGIFALVAPFLYYAKTANVDVPYLFWFAVSMVLYLQILDQLRLRDFILFAACATFSVCTKDQAYGMFLLMPLPIVAQIARANRQAGIARPFWRALVDRRLLAAALTAAVLFAAIHNLVFNLGGFREHVAFIVGPGSVTYQVFDATIAGRLALARFSAHLIQESFGWPFFVAAGIGLGIAAFTRRLRLMATWLMVPAVSYYFGFINVVLYSYDRFVLPICFVLAVFAGFSLDQLLVMAKVSGTGLARDRDRCRISVHRLCTRRRSTCSWSGTRATLPTAGSLRTSKRATWLRRFSMPSISRGSSDFILSRLVPSPNCRTSGPSSMC